MQEMINYSRLQKIVCGQEAVYKNAMPFPHIVIDDFIDKNTVRELLGNFPTITSKSSAHEIFGQIEGTPAQLKKKWVAMELKTPMPYRKLYRELSSADFLSLLENLTGIDNLLTDPHRQGGGIHETTSGGFLKVHADFNVHPHFHYYRRVNFLLYLNEDWQESWKGDLQLWDKEGRECVKRISPIAGRAVIFSTSSRSFHGHPEPLACPPNNSRKSIALYYYQKQPDPVDGQLKMHLTLWKKS